MKNMSPRRVESEHGFTLTELLVVILIIGILAAIAIPMFLNQREAAKESSLKSDLKNVGTAIEGGYDKETGYPNVNTVDAKTSPGNSIKKKVVRGNHRERGNHDKFCLMGLNPDVNKPWFYSSINGKISANPMDCTDEDYTDSPTAPVSNIPSLKCATVPAQMVEVEMLMNAMMISPDWMLEDVRSTGDPSYSGWNERFLSDLWDLDEQVWSSATMDDESESADLYDRMTESEEYADYMDAVMEMDYFYTGGAYYSHAFAGVEQDEFDRMIITNGDINSVQFKDRAAADTVYANVAQRNSALIDSICA